jgi:hypothetical protein
MYDLCTLADFSMQNIILDAVTIYVVLIMNVDILLRTLKNVPDTSEKHSKNVPDTSDKHSKNVPDTSEKHSKNVPDTSEKHSKNVPVKTDHNKPIRKKKIFIEIDASDSESESLPKKTSVTSYTSKTNKSAVAKKHLQRATSDKTILIDNPKCKKKASATSYTSKTNKSAVAKKHLQKATSDKTILKFYLFSCNRSTLWYPFSTVIVINVSY